MMKMGVCNISVYDRGLSMCVKNVVKFLEIIHLSQKGTYSSKMILWETI